LEAFIRLSAGVIILAYLVILPIEPVTLFAAWILSGIAEIVVAIELSKEMSSEWPLPMAGMMSIMFGTLLLLLANEDVLAVVMGSYEIIFGLVLLTLSLQLHQIADAISAAAALTSELNHLR
jgi:uncharacterized membrane protein HdeD (DUF308 family)